MNRNRFWVLLLFSAFYVEDILGGDDLIFPTRDEIVDAVFHGTQNERGCCQAKSV